MVEPKKPHMAIQFCVKRCALHARQQRQEHALTNSMDQSPSWEANRSSATQEIPRILWNPKIHYRINKNPPYVLSWADPSSPCPHIPLPEDSFYYCPSIYAWVIQVVYFPQVSPLKPCMHLSSSPYVLHTVKNTQTHNITYRFIIH